MYRIQRHKGKHIILQQTCSYNVITFVSAVSQCEGNWSMLNSKELMWQICVAHALLLRITLLFSCVLCKAYADVKVLDYGCTAWMELIASALTQESRDTLWVFPYHIRAVLFKCASSHVNDCPDLFNSEPLSAALEHPKLSWLSEKISERSKSFPFCAFGFNISLL